MSSFGAQLQVVWPDDDRPATTAAPAPSKLSPEMTLPEFFARYAWPDCLAPKGDSVRTRRDYEKSLDYWRVFTGNPALDQIDKRTCSRFVAELSSARHARTGETLAANTVHKHWVNLERLLRWSGPANRQNPEGAAVIDSPPWIKGPRKQKPSPRAGFALDEIQRWLEVLDTTAKITVPPAARDAVGDPPAWWRAVILFDYNTGLRPGTLFCIRWEMLAGHWLTVPTGIVKGEDGLRIWLNEPAIRAIEPLRRPAGLVLGWPNWPAAETTFRKQRIRQQASAGIRQLPLYALRRCFSTELAKINPLAAQIMMGHKGLGMQMMIDHYVDPEQLLGDALARLPQPGRLVQRELF